MRRFLQVVVLGLTLSAAAAWAERPYDDVEREVMDAVRETRRLEALRAEREGDARALSAEVETEKREGGLISTFTLPRRLGDLHEVEAEICRLDRSIAKARRQIDVLYEAAVPLCPPERRDRLETVSGRAARLARSRLAAAEAAFARGEASEEDLASARRAARDAARAYEAVYR